MTAYFMEWDDAQVWSSREDALLSMLSPQRQAACMRYRFQADRNRCLYSALLLRLLLCNLFQIEWHSLLFEKSRYGKPYLLFHNDIQFNISHTAGAILCATSKYAIGADTEVFGQIHPELIQYCFHPEEKNYLFSSHECQQIHKFYEIWTRKEAFLKCQGTGLAENLSEQNTLHHNLQPHFHLWKTAHAQYTCFTEQITDAAIRQISQEELLSELSHFS